MTKTEVKLARELEILRRSVVEMSRVFQSMIDSEKEVIKLISLVGKKMVQMDDKLNTLVGDVIERKSGIIVKK